MTPQRIAWSRFDGLPMPKTARLVTRGSRFGNPFRLCPHRTREQAVAQFEAFLPSRTVDPSWLCPCDPEDTMRRAARYPSAQQIRNELGGMDVVCCPPGSGPCHGDPLIAAANGGGR